MAIGTTCRQPQARACRHRTTHGGGGGVVTTTGSKIRRCLPIQQSYPLRPTSNNDRVMYHIRVTLGNLPLRPSERLNITVHFSLRRGGGGWTDNCSVTRSTPQKGNPPRPTPKKVHLKLLENSAESYVSDKSLQEYSHRQSRRRDDCQSSAPAWNSS